MATLFPYRGPYEDSKGPELYERLRGMGRHRGFSALITEIGVNTNPQS